MRIVAWDLETSDLAAIMGRIFCCSFLPIRDGVPDKPYSFRLDQKRFRAGSVIDDSKLAQAIREELERHHPVVGWNSRLFDAPLFNTRLSKAGKRPRRPSLSL